SGTIVCSSASARSRSSVVGTKGGRSAFDEGKYDSSLRTPAAHSCSLRGRKCATPEVALCTCPPPSSSNDTASPVTTLITSGPAVDLAEAGDHAVARDLPVLHAEPVRSVRGENVQLHERAFVEQHLDPIARRRFARRSAFVGGLCLGVQRLVATLAVLVDLLLRYRRLLALRRFDSFKARGGSPNRRQRARFPGSHSAYRRRRAAGPSSARSRPSGHVAAAPDVRHGRRPEQLQPRRAAAQAQPAVSLLPGQGARGNPWLASA